MATFDKGTWWRTQRLTTAAQVLRRLASATDRWVIVGEDSGSPLILTVETADFNDASPTFTARTPNGSDPLWDVAYIGTEDRVNAVGDNGRVEFSLDKGQTWSSLALPGGEDLRGIVGVSGDANSRFVAVGDGRVYGQNSSGVWSARWSGASSWLSVAHRATAGWVAVGTTGDGLYSADGLTWGSAFKIDPTLVENPDRFLHHSGRCPWQQ